MHLEILSAKQKKMLPLVFSLNAPDFKTADLATLGALKAYALGRRAKWKDYVDLYFIFKSGCDINKIVTRARLIFGSVFSEKIFYQQLAYFSDIDYSEAVEYLPGFAVSDRVIKQSLRKASLSVGRHPKKML
ncbi:MAG: nucleotidyl transferase AbiEii/AbiGii toxin family protein [Candidatus Falkowbacteria bacterium]|nr:nucleotidyl transferase AbiEii/AbiGii toxin family protein [Candidatus Falkowbacteria bacterium]